MLSHLDHNQQPAMVDISHKKDSFRLAIAETQIQLPQPLKDYLQGQELFLKKGPVIQAAVIAGTMAVKKTADLIPFCHSLPIESCKFTTQISEDLLITLRCEVKTSYKTGVEMEALCGVSVAALTLYDMCKSVSSHIVIQNTCLVQKSGGQSDTVPPPLYGLVLTGGRSQRMGKDKALIDYRGQPHALYLYELLSQYCQQVFLSARPQQWQETVLESLPILADCGESRGPFTGILTALETYPQVNWLIVACDLAYLQAGAVAHLIAQAHLNRAVTCYENPQRGFPEALCGFYTPKALHLFQKAARAELYCPVKILQMGDCHLLKPHHPMAVANVNTPEERPLTLP